MNYINNEYRRSNITNEFNDNIDPYGNDYLGTHILPRSRDEVIKKRREEEYEKYKDIWSRDIEVRKNKKLEEKRKKEEMDILEEQRIKKEIEEINRREERERQRQKEKENDVYKENEQLMKQKNKGKNKKAERGINDDDINKINEKKAQLVKSESFNYNESLVKLKNKYKDVDLNNIHFYRKNRKNEENKKMIENKLYYNRIKNNIINNKRKVNEFEFSPNPKLLDDSKNPQIARLKREVNNGYMQISSYMKNLRKNVIEADKNKTKAEKELIFIIGEIDKEKKYQLYLDKIEYEKNKNDESYYNKINQYTNVNDVDPIYYNIMPVNQSNMREDKNQMSNLAKMGQSLIKLSSESEFVPLGMNHINYNNIGINEQILLEDNVEKEELQNETVFQKSED